MPLFSDKKHQHFKINTQDENATYISNQRNVIMESKEAIQAPIEIWSQFPRPIYGILFEFLGPSFSTVPDNTLVFSDCKKARGKDDCFVALFVLRIANLPMEKLKLMGSYHCRDWDIKRSLMESILLHWDPQARTMFLRHCVQKATDLLTETWGSTHHQRHAMFSEICSSHLQNISHVSDAKEKKAVMDYHGIDSNWFEHFRHHLDPENYVNMMEMFLDPARSHLIMEGGNFRDFSLAQRKRVFDWFGRVNPGSMDQNFMIHLPWFVAKQQEGRMKSFCFGSQAADDIMDEYYMRCAQREMENWQKFCAPLARNLLTEIVDSKSPTRTAAEYKIGAKWCDFWVKHVSSRDMNYLVRVAGIRLSPDSHKVLMDRVQTLESERRRRDVSKDGLFNRREPGAAKNRRGRGRGRGRW